MKKNDYIKEGAKGVLTGASMLVPGISGGTMALIFGYYDRLINAAAGIFKNFKKNIFTILFYMITVAAGFVIFSWPMSFLLENFSFIMFCFFVGTIIGSLVLFKKKAMIEKFRLSDIIYFLIGVAVSLGITLIPADVMAYNAEGGFFGNLILYIIAGILLSIALILPGISTSHVLLILGIQSLILDWVKTLDIIPLLPFVIITLIFIFAFIKILEFALNKKARMTYMMIAGFVLFSAADITIDNIFPFIADASLTSGYILNMIAGVLIFILGLSLTAYISKKAKTD